MAGVDGIKICPTCGRGKTLDCFKHGHRPCVSCLAARKNALRARPGAKARAKATAKKWRVAHREEQRAKEAQRRSSIEFKTQQRRRNQEWQRKNRDYVSAKAWLYRLDDLTVQERMRESNRKNGPAIGARRRALLKNALPTWSDLSAVKSVYLGARRMSHRFGKRFHVDHIVPLQHAAVCGLHVWANLQVLDGPVNQAKGNHWWPDMPDEL